MGRFDKNYVHNLFFFILVDYFNRFDDIILYFKINMSI
jgi:hypothetical protein